MKNRILSVLIVLLVLLLTGCEAQNNSKDTKPYPSQFPNENGGIGGEGGGAPSYNENVGNDDSSFGDSLDNLGVFDGVFEENEESISIKCESGTEGAYTIENNIITFTEIYEDSVYSIAGKLKGSIVIDIVNDYKLDLEMCGFSLISEKASPITIISGDEISITAKNGYDNYIYDNREAISEEDEGQHSGAIYSYVDLEICGKGSLTLVSENNNGIHTKDDLQIKNLTLLVSCVDNALKGNDSVEIEGGKLTLISKKGDGIKTTNSDISEKGNQRGTILIVGGNHTIYSACDGIDSAYDVIIDDSTTSLTIYTDKYSNYSEEITSIADDNRYIRFTSNEYKYSVKYYNSDDDFEWCNAEYYSTVGGGRYNYYYYSFPKKDEYSKIQFFIYSSDMESSQDTEYLAATEYLSINTAYDTFALTSRGNSISYSWTNYTTQIQEGGMGRPGGMGGMNEGNSDKGDYSTKGIKASNKIEILNGNITIKSYDDAIHANNDEALENSKEPLGNVIISGGTISLYSNDDGIHADGQAIISNGDISITHSYEGIEGSSVELLGGKLYVISNDDGINGTATTGTAIRISGGMLYVYCNGDGIDSNSRSSYQGICFDGGDVVVISSSGGNSAIDTENGYSFTGGNVVAIMPNGGMTSEATHCSNFSSVATNMTAQFTKGSYVTISVNGSPKVTIKMTSDVSGRIIYLGSTQASVSTSQESENTSIAYWY